MVRPRKAMKSSPRATYATRIYGFELLKPQDDQIADTKLERGDPIHWCCKCFNKLTVSGFATKVILRNPVLTAYQAVKEAGRSFTWNSIQSGRWELYFLFPVRTDTHILR